MMYLVSGIVLIWLILSCSYIDPHFWDTQRAGAHIHIITAAAQRQRRNLWEIAERDVQQLNDHQQEAQRVAQQRQAVARELEIQRQIDEINQG
jgi:hypothetical protein